MKCKRLLGVGLSLCLLLGGLTACGENKSDMPDLSSLGAMTILAREDGSGTKEEFENLAGTQEKGATAQAQSTQDVEKTLASDKNAIGYAAYGSLSKDSGVRLLSIDGVAPTPETVRDNSYPLCRKYSLAYSGQLTAVENDFFGHTIDVAGLLAGQDIAAQLRGQVQGRRVLLPLHMLRHGETVFLDDYTVERLSEELGSPIQIVGVDGGDLLDAILETEV